MYVMSPVSWPISKLLDVLLGEEEGNYYKRDGVLFVLQSLSASAGRQVVMNDQPVTTINKKPAPEGVPY
jgi:hypothetical protein